MEEVPSITGQATPTFFAYASKVAVQLVKENFKAIHLPDVEARVSIPVVGHLHLKLMDIKLDELSLERTDTGLELGQDGTLVLHVTGLDAVVNCNFHFDRSGFGPSFGGGGHAKITAEDGTARVELRVLNDGVGRPRLLIQKDAEVAFGNLDVEISDSGLAWLLNVIISIAQGPIKDATTRQVAHVITNQLPKEVNKLLLGVPITVDVKGFQLNTSMAGDPLVSAANLQVSDWGRFQSPAGIWEECPYKRLIGTQQPLSAQTFSPLQAASSGRPQQSTPTPHAAAAPDSMLFANIDQSIVNCFTWVLFQRGLLDRQFEGDDLPGSALYTTTWLLAVPQLPLKYPNREMAVQVHVLEPPDAVIKTAEGMATTGSATLSFFLAAGAADSRPHESSAADTASSTLLEAFKQALATNGTTETQILTPVRAVRGNNVYGTAVPPLANSSNPVGQHLFTLRIAAKLTATELDIQPDLPDRPHDFRLMVNMALAQDSLAVVVEQSDIGDIDASRLKIMLKLVAALVQEQINDDILAGGFPLPAIPHIDLVDPSVVFADGSLALASSLQYVQ
ncbi:hypothetical protein WJX72_008927 [[Myrmecia] bisecta]|uniref:Lipid-binding serum glycoprotein C-terminal domain-containing protein n=1 Tax=[Myrmecia] bisecta TaxID=41462 RepID=A0AAW1PZ12_9CHLO